MAGCGGESFDLAPVAGQVTLDGEPLPDALVTFQPIAQPGQRETPGPGSYGHTDSQGRYTLKTVGEDRPGAVVGPHRVFISAAKADPNEDPSAPGRPVEDPVPAQYRNGALSFTVSPEGTESADFRLE